MSTTEDFVTVRVEPERDRYGRYLIVPAKGGKARSYTRATTIAETLDDRYNLEAWKQRMVALGLAQRPDLYASVASLPHDDKQQLNRLCDQAREAAAGSAGANLGTALHRFTERINRLEHVVVPAPWDKDIEAYQQALDHYGWNPDQRYLERIVVLEEFGIAGMFDLILNGHIADLKTGATLDFSWCAIAVQLALYAHADTIYDPSTKTHEAMPPVDQDKALVIHLPAGKATCTLYEVDIAAGWEAAQHALWVRNWRKRKDLAVPATQVGGGEPVPAGTVEQAPPVVDVGGGEPSRPPVAATLTDILNVPQTMPDPYREAQRKARRQEVIDHIKRLPDVERDELARRWPVGVPTFKQSDVHTDEQLDAIAAMLDNVDWSPKKPNPEPQEPEPELPPAARVEIDEGVMLDDDTVGAIKVLIGSLDNVTLTQVNEWARESHEAQRPFSLSREEWRTERRFEIMRAAIALSPYEPDVQRAALELVAPDLKPEAMMHSIGALLGSLTLSEAKRLCTLAEALGQTVAVVYDAHGLHFDGPGLATVAA